ncbi:hypothetical protein ACFU7Z_13600 [Kitasatospora sp. NPDC057518]|uniref:hypothetical protein n=1 Tax=Kitasatospora sp. NPDC057518 TaxID=3346155 RepID=UPI00367E7AF7
MTPEEVQRIITAEEAHMRRRLEQMVRELGRDAEHSAQRLRPWVNRAATRRGKAVPEAVSALLESSAWLRRNAWLPSLKGWPSYKLDFRGDVFEIFLDMDFSPHFTEKDRWRLENDDGRFVQRNIDIDYEQMVGIAEICQEARVVGNLLEVPEEAHPSRYGKLPDGVLARFISEDLAERIEAGRRLAEQLARGASGEETVRSWAEQTRVVLRRLGRDAPLDGIVWRSELCEHPDIADPVALGRLYLYFGLKYVEEVAMRIPEWDEASRRGQQAESITVYGPVGAIRSNVTNSSLTVAETITHIGATADALANAGQRDIAAAVRDLTQAIRQDSGLEESRRADLLDHVADIADAAAQPDRPRVLSRARLAIAALTSAAGASTQLAQAVTTWHDIFNQFT